MSATDPTPKLDQLLNMVQDIRTSTQSQRVFDVLEVIRDEVNDLSRQHESIRSEIRAINTALLQQQNQQAQSD